MDQSYKSEEQFDVWTRINTIHWHKIQQYIIMVNNFFQTSRVFSTQSKQTLIIIQH